MSGRLVVVSNRVSAPKSTTAGNQGGLAVALLAALREKGVPVAYLLFAGEQHGFRRAENIRRALDAELAFYSRLFGFALPRDEGIEPVEIENLA